ncbi:DUF4031 domain-containing protein [Paraburkholderia sp. J8-2]|uniref:DUF4031 domain-containing protein n=1 Tax=Paraburkholderia sp. J8-2 TaxID=2805440 RepID=UPI002AB6A39C|nr:DUF4031 domain-containing protein [Paraburkholderia sp. J8-2]
MTIYVDRLEDWGFIIRGRRVRSCHLFTDGHDIEELHRFAERIGMRREWFQVARSAPHYDLTPSRRAEAVRLGAIEVGRREAVAIWRARREVVASGSVGPTTP